MGYIYLITNKLNGKHYVGQTIRKDIRYRWNQHRSNKSGDTIISRAYNKYGIENFKFQIICICFDEDCDKYEMEYIKKYNSLSPNGYNLREGGKNSHHSDETKKKIGLKSKEYRNNEVIKIEYSKKFKGKKMNEDVKKRMYSTMTEENKINKNKNLLKGSQKCKKKINQYTKDNIFIKSFDSITEASSELNIDASKIGKVCNNIKYYKTAGGYIWKFI